MSNNAKANGKKPVVVSSSVTFDSVIYPGVTYTLHRMTTGRRTELERRMLPYHEKVTNIYREVEEANVIDSSKPPQASSQTPIVELNVATSAVPKEGEGEDTASSPSPATTAVKDKAYWDRVVRQRVADNKCATLAQEELRPMYLEAYLKRVDNLVVELEEDENGEVEQVKVTTAQDVLKYAAVEFVDEIFHSIRNSREPGIGLSAIELLNLGLPTTLPPQVVGSKNEAGNGTATDAKSQETTSV